MTDNQQYIQIIECLQSIDDYRKTKKLLEQLRSGDQQLCLNFSKAISNTIKDQNTAPISKLLAVRVFQILSYPQLAKDVIDINLPESNNLIANTVLLDME